MNFADTLSRASIRDTNHTDLYDDLSITTSRMEEIREATKTDKALSVLQKVTNDGLPANHDVPSELKPYLIYNWKMNMYSFATFVKRLFIESYVIECQVQNCFICQHRDRGNLNI